MASAGNRHCANCIGTVSFAIFVCYTAAQCSRCHSPISDGDGGVGVNRIHSPHNQTPAAAAAASAALRRPRCY